MSKSTAIVYDCALFFLRVIANIFFREIRPRGAWNIPKDGPVIFVAAPHHNQFLDPILLASEIWRETHRRVSFLIAAKSMKQRIVGFLASLMNSSMSHTPVLADSIH
jgi:glycerol-3-phosphate O-acyltransferase/dihydroxyacetone phosphate acyltransferase